MPVPRLRSSELRTRDGFVAALNDLKAASPLSYAKLGRRINAPASTVHGWCRGHHLPYARETERFVLLLEALGVDDTTPWVTALNRLRSGEQPDERPNPYRGLEPYTEGDRHDFVGRSDVVARLVDAVRRRLNDPHPHPVVVLGPSGSGKTSALRAGMTPALRDDGVRVHAHAASESLLTELRRELAATPTGFGPDVVIVDQVEMVLSAGGSHADEVFATIERLGQAGVTVVVSLRADFFEEASARPVLLPAIQHDPVIVTAPTRSDIVDLIVQPAERAGLDVDPDLLAELTRVFDDESITGQVALPLLSHVLYQLADHAERNRLTLDAYRRLGGLHLSLAHAAADTYEALDHAEQRACQTLFLLLVELGDHAVPVRRALPLADLDEFADPDRDEVADATTTTRRSLETVIDRFIDQHLLTIDRGQLLISHERLITAWPTLDDWITDARLNLLTSRRISIASLAWAEADREDGLLLSGAVLDEAIELLDAHTLRLSPLARDFVVQSSRRRDRWRQRSAELGSRQLAMQAALVAEPSVAHQLAAIAWRVAPTPEARAAVMTAHRRGARTRLLGEGGFMTVRVAPDGRHAVANFGPGNAPVLLHHDRGAWRRQRPVHTAILEPVSLAWAPSGFRLAISGEDRDVEVIDVDPTGTADTSLQHGGLGGARTTALCWVDDRHLLVGDGGDLALWSAVTGGWSSRPIVRGPARFTAATVATRPDGEILIATADLDGALRLWATRSIDEPTKPVWAHERTDAVAASAVAIDVELGVVAGGWFSGEVAAWALGSDSRIPEQLIGGDPTFGTWVNDLTIAPDRSALVAASSDGTVQRWTTSDWTHQSDVLDHPSVVTAVEFTFDGLLTSCEDGAVRLWPPTGPATDDPASVWSTPLDSNGRLVVGTRNDVRRIRFDDAHTLAEDRRWTPAEFGAPNLSGMTATFARGDRWVAGGRSGDVYVVGDTSIRLDTTTGQLVEAVAVCRDRIVISADRSGTVSSWVLADAGSQRAEPVSSVRIDPPALSVSVDPGGQLGCVTSEIGTCQLFRIDDDGTLRTQASWRAGESFSISSTFHPTKPLIAVGNADRRVSLWSISDPTRPEVVARLTEPAGHVFGVAFSADGTLLAGASTDRNVWLWDASRPEEPTLLAQLESDSRGMYAVTFADDDRLLVAAGSQAAIRVWHLDVERMVDEILDRSGDPLTTPEWERLVPPNLDRLVLDPRPALEG